MPVTGTGTGLRWFLCPGQEKKGKGVRGDRMHWRVQGSMSSPTGISSRRRLVWGVMEFGMSRRIKPKEIYVRISMKEIWRNLDGPSKYKELWSYVVKFEFSRPKSSSSKLSDRCALILTVISSYRITTPWQKHTNNTGRCVETAVI